MHKGTQGIVYKFHLKPNITIKPLPYKKRTDLKTLKVTFKELLVLIRGEFILRESLIEELSNDLTILDSLNKDD